MPPNFQNSDLNDVLPERPKQALPGPQAEAATPDTAEIEALRANAQDAAAFLKAIAHEGRLMILCHLFQGERTVTQLEALLDTRQATVSQHLSRLRAEGLVTSRRDGKLIHYALTGEKSQRMVETLSDLFCSPK